MYAQYSENSSPGSSVYNWLGLQKENAGGGSLMELPQPSQRPAPDIHTLPAMTGPFHLWFLEGGADGGEGFTRGRGTNPCSGVNVNEFANIGFAHKTAQMGFTLAILRYILLFLKCDAISSNDFGVFCYLLCLNSFDYL